jgi:hypothetical protein
LELKEAIASLVKEIHKELGLEDLPKVKLRDDEENSKNILGKTAHYSPQENLIVVYRTNRHPKDILRSLAHELVHHHQHERGDLGNHETPPGYAQEDGHMRKMEMEAYLKGNMMLRDWEDNIKNKKDNGRIG